jgi:hypothetical protein
MVHGAASTDGADFVEGEDTGENAVAACAGSGISANNKDALANSVATLRAFIRVSLDEFTEKSISIHIARAPEVLP